MTMEEDAVRIPRLTIARAVQQVAVRIEEPADGEEEGTARWQSHRRQDDDRQARRLVDDPLDPDTAIIPGPDPAATDRAHDLVMGPDDRAGGIERLVEGQVDRHPFAAAAPWLHDDPQVGRVHVRPHHVDRLRAADDVEMDVGVAVRDEGRIDPGPGGLGAERDMDRGPPADGEGPQVGRQRAPATTTVPWLGAAGTNARPAGVASVNTTRAAAEGL